MIRLIHAEAIKLRSTRTFYLITFGALVMIAIAAFGQTFGIVLGVMAVTGEFRHRTITAALLITPKRARLIVAKTVVVFLAGLAFGLVAFAGTVAIVLPILSARHIASDVSGTQIAEIITGGTLVTAVLAAFGVGVGTVIRDQAGAIIATLALLFAIEPLLTILPGVGNVVQTYGVAGLSSAA